MGGMALGGAALGGLALSVAGCASDTDSSGNAPAARDAAQADLPEAARAPLDALGVQLYTLRSLLETEVNETLAQVAQIGYQTVETAGFYGLTAPQMRQRLDTNGLSTPSGHYPLEQLRGGGFGQIASAARALGQQFVVCPYLAEGARGSLDAYRALADEFNQIGRRLQEEDLRFAYHNHDFEFDAFGGDVPAYDVLLDSTDPDLVAFEMDIYWVYAAGYEPLQYVERYPGRFPLFHLKDGTAPPEKEMVNVGAGAIDFAALLAEAEQAGLEYTFVEHDNPQDPLANIRASYQHLDTLSS